MLEKRGQEPFKDFEHFKKSVIGIVSESQLEKLIFAQTCSGFGLNTKTLIEHKSFKSVEYYAYIDQVKIDILEEYPLMTLIQKEKEALGFNITYDIKTLLDACKEMHLDDLKVKKTVRVACVMDISKKIKTKQGEEMAFFNVFDGYQHIEATMFPKIFSEYKHFIDQPYVLADIEKTMYKEKESYQITLVKKIV
jgi:DNA polymerase-3 subunit alpha